MRKLGFITAALGCLAAFPAAADDNTPVAEHTDRIQLDTAYPARWCIKSYLNVSPKRATVVSSRFDEPVYGESRVHTAADTEHYRRPLYRSMVASLKRLGKRHWMTLWKGRETSVVVGYQDGGYIGFSLTENEPTKD